MAELHPLTARRLDLPHRCVLFELDLSAWRDTEVIEAGYTPTPRFPAVYRDYAVVVNRSTPASDVANAIHSAAPSLIREVTFQSVYTGDGVSDDKKSIAWSVTLQREDRTMTEPEVRDVEEAIWSALETSVGGSPRA